MMTSRRVAEELEPAFEARSGVVGHIDGHPIVLYHLHKGVPQHDMTTIASFTAIMIASITITDIIILSSRDHLHE